MFYTYCIAKSKTVNDNSEEVRLPCFSRIEGLDYYYHYLAEPCSRSEFALYGVSPKCGTPLEELYQIEGVTEIDHYTRLLLDSAESFPPTLALLKEYFGANSDRLFPLNPGLAMVREHFGINPLTKEADENDFAREIRKFLESFFSKCNQLKFQYTQCLADPGSGTSSGTYLIKGRFYWLVSYRPKTDSIDWVSRDFFVYRDSRDYFAISKETAEESLFVVSE
jgi:hypothetical protein